MYPINQATQCDPFPLHISFCILNVISVCVSIIFIKFCLIFGEYFYYLFCKSTDVCTCITTFFKLALILRMSSQHFVIAWAHKLYFCHYQQSFQSKWYHSNIKLKIVLVLFDQGDITRSDTPSLVDV